MKILYVCDKLATFIVNEVVELKSRGHDVTILAYHSEAIYENITRPMLIEHGLDEAYHRYSSSIFRSRLARYLRFIRMIVHDLLVHPRRTGKFLKFILSLCTDRREGLANYFEVRPVIDREIDIIHSPFSTPDAMDKVYLLSNILKVPFTLCYRAHDIYRQNAFSEVIQRTDIISRASRLITISGYNRERMRETLHVDTPIEIIHSALEPGFFRPDAGIQRSARSIVSVCRLSEQKGVIHLVEACHILRQRNIDYECTIIGEGSENDTYEQRVRDRIRELQIPNIKFLDFQTRSEIRDHLNRAAVFVLPCIITPSGLRDILANSLKEAMAMEVPVVTSNICGIEELVEDGISGILVAAHDSAAIADAVERLFENPGLARRMGVEARKKVERDFDAKLEVGKLEAIFREVLTR